MSRSKRRVDGSLRPAVAKYAAKRRHRKRVEWLSEFTPGARKEFFDNVLMKDTIFARPFARAGGFTEAEAEKMLADLAARLPHWLTLRTASGRVVGLGPDKRQARRSGPQAQSLPARKGTPHGA